MTGLHAQTTENYEHSRMMMVNNSINEKKVQRNKSHFRNRFLLGAHGDVILEYFIDRLTESSCFEFYWRLINILIYTIKYWY